MRAGPGKQTDGLRRRQISKAHLRWGFGVQEARRGSCSERGKKFGFSRTAAEVLAIAWPTSGMAVLAAVRPKPVPPDGRFLRSIYDLDLGQRYL